MKKNNITVIGSGLAGSFFAVLLAQRGYHVTVYEKLSKEEIFEANDMRSYNITFYAYGIDLLKKANMWTTIEQYLTPLKGASTQLSKYAKPIFSPIYNEKTQYYGISRSELVKLLITKALESHQVEFFFNTSFVTLNRSKKTVSVQNIKSKEIETFTTDIVVGADGANSLVRSFMQQGQDTLHSQSYSDGGYRQFVITKEHVAILGLQSTIGYTWSAKEKFILAFPNKDGSLSALMILPTSKQLFEKNKTEATLEAIIHTDFPILSPIAKEISSQLVNNPTGVFTTIKTTPWYYKDFITIIGDSAHGFYPFFGQGASAAFGDSMEIAKLIDTYGTMWDKILPLYQDAREKHMNALGELSEKALLRYARYKRADYSVAYEKLESLGHTFFPKYIQAPVYQPVMNNPAKTADFVAKHTKQRKIAKWIATPVAARLLTYTMACYEFIEKLGYKKKKIKAV